jgi:hypothetical protein
VWRQQPALKNPGPRAEREGRARNRRKTPFGDAGCAINAIA